MKEENTVTEEIKEEEMPIIEMATDSMGKNLLQTLLDEVKQMQKPYQQMNQLEQKETLRRFNSAIRTQVNAAINSIVANGSPIILADIESITIKNGIKAVLKVSSGSDQKAKQELFGSEGCACLLVINDITNYLKGMADIQPEPNQQLLKLGHEYNEKNSGIDDQDRVEGEKLESSPSNAGL